MIKIAKNQKDIKSSGMMIDVYAVRDKSLGEQEYYFSDNKDRHYYSIKKVGEVGYEVQERKGGPIIYRDITGGYQRDKQSLYALDEFVNNPADYKIKYETIGYNNNGVNTRSDSYVSSKLKALELKAIIQIANIKSDETIIKKNEAYARVVASYRNELNIMVNDLIKSRSAQEMIEKTVNKRKGILQDESKFELPVFYSKLINDEKQAVEIILMDSSLAAERLGYKAENQPTNI